MLNIKWLKKQRRNKRKRDKQKKSETFLKKVSGVILTHHAVNRCNERHVTSKDIKGAFNHGRVKQQNAKEFIVYHKKTCIVVVKDSKYHGKDVILYVKTTWKRGQ
jgi:hypothetical protein